MNLAEKRAAAAARRAEYVQRAAPQLLDALRAIVTNKQTSEALHNINPAALKAAHDAIFAATGELHNLP